MVKYPDLQNNKYISKQNKMPFRGRLSCEFQKLSQTQTQCIISHAQVTGYSFPSLVSVL